jgi:hypothetical protein
MKILQCDKEHIFVNRETGGAGSSIYMPDTMDEYRWCKVTVEDYNKWIAKDNKQAIHDSIKEQLLAAATITTMSEVSEGSSPVEGVTDEVNTAIQDIDPTKIEITLPDTVFTFGDLIATTGSTIYNKDVDLKDVQVIYDTEIKNKQ